MIQTRRGSRKDLCSNCHNREATENWVGDGGMMAYAHGMYSRWRKICVLEAQIASIRRSMKRLPALEEEFKMLKDKNKSVRKH